METSSTTSDFCTGLARLSNSIFRPTISEISPPRSISSFTAFDILAVPEYCETVADPEQFVHLMTNKHHGNIFRFQFLNNAIRAFHLRRR